MAYPTGGRSDKYGNRFEYNWTIEKLLDVIDEEITYVKLEAVGDEERGIDLWIGNIDGSEEGQQCKGRNASKENWTFSDAEERHNIFTKWHSQLMRGESINVSLVLPLSFTMPELWFKTKKFLFYGMEVCRCLLRCRNL